MIGVSNLAFWLIAAGIISGLFITFVMQILWGFGDDDEKNDSDF